MSNELATAPAELPEHLKKYYSGTGDHRQDFGDLSAAAFGTSFLKLVHQMSREAKPNWGGNNEPAIPVGTMFLYRNRKIIPPNTPFIPLLRRTTYIKWIGKP